MGDAEAGVWYAMTLAIGNEGKAPRGDSWNPPIEMNRWLPPDALGRSTAGGRGLRVVTPPVDVRIGDDGIMLVADMPGIPPDNIDIRVMPGYIEIIGIPPEDDGPGTGPVPALYPGGPGALEKGRTGGGAMAGGARAMLRDGVLELRLPKDFVLSGGGRARIPVG